jgi:predicted aspartyl protease
VIILRRFSCAILAALLLSLFAGQAAAQSAWPKECKLHRLASFPMRAHGLAFTIPIKINGVEKKFLIDTGGYASTINEDVAGQLGIPLHKIWGVQHIDIAGKSAQNFVTVDSFEIAGFKGKNFSFVANAAGGDYFDGTIAPDFLRAFDVELDFANETMTLFKPHECAGRAVYWTSAYLSLPMRITDSGHIRVKAALDGKELDAVLDTGASRSLMALTVAGRMFDLKPGGEVTKAESITGATGSSLESYSYAFKALSLGEITLNHPKIALYDGSDALHSEGAELILGMSELRFLHLYLAYHERELYVSVGEKH